MNKEVKIGGYYYKVVETGGPFVSGEDVLDGQHDFTNLEIKLASMEPTPYNKTVFLHEILHGIIEIYCEGILEPEVEEKLVQQLAKGLYTTMKENPEIFGTVRYKGTHPDYGKPEDAIASATIVEEMKNDTDE